jgi:predicted nucleic acid-binding protein
MLIVADSSPLHYLLQVGYVDILPRLFGQVVIPVEVQREWTHAAAPQPVRAFASNPPAWLTVRAPRTSESIPQIDPGECAAINLAREVQANLLLIDDLDGRAAATARGVAVIGTIGVLELAAAENPLSLPEAIDRIRCTTFRASDALLSQALQRDAQRQSRGGPGDPAK